MLVSRAMSDAQDVVQIEIKCIRLVKSSFGFDFSSLY